MRTEDVCWFAFSSLLAVAIRSCSDDDYDCENERIFCMNTQNIYLAVVRRRREKARENGRMTQFLSGGGFFYCTLALAPIAFSSAVDWFC